MTARATDPTPWGWRPVLVPLLALIALIVVGSILSEFAEPSGYAARVAFAVVVNFVVDGLLAYVVWHSARPIALRHGGWGPAFGLLRPRWSDLRYAGVGIVVTFVLRVLVVGVANGLSHGHASKEAQNIQVHHVTAVGVVLLVAVVVVWAPLVEELLFRGVLLRSFMRGWSFWPAAVASTAIFAALHVYEVHTVAGAATLAASVACLGMVNCYLSRITGRLAPGMIVHAAFNLLAVIVLVSQANS